MDPPYGKGLEADLLSTLKTCASVNEDTTIIIEADINEDFSFAEDMGYNIVKEKKYKTNKHIFLLKR